MTGGAERIANQIEKIGELTEDQRLVPIRDQFLAEREYLLNLRAWCAELRRELNALHGASDEERTARFNSEEFRNKFDAHERSLVQDLVAALPE